MQSVLLHDTVLHIVDFSDKIKKVLDECQLFVQLKHRSSGIDRWVKCVHVQVFQIFHVLYDENSERLILYSMNKSLANYHAIEICVYVMNTVLWGEMRGMDY